jgi:uncharacterized protein YndB with AHSA1/START domain
MNRVASVPKRQVGKTRAHGLVVRARKTVAAPAAAVFAAWTQPRLRGRWLVGVQLTVREAHAPRSVRLACRDDDTEIAVAITPRGRAASAVVVDHSRLATAQLAAERRHCWKEMLRALKHYLERPA